MHISFEAFTKDPFLVSCRSPPQIEALSCIFQVTTNRCMGELVRQEAQSYIQFFSSCLPLKPNSEDETPSSRLPSNTRRQLHLFVWILASVREGGDPTSGPPSLSHCASRRDTGITVILVIMTILVYLVILLIWVILVDMLNLVDILYLVILVILVILVNLENMVILVILVNQVNMVELVNMTDLMNLVDLLQDCDEYSNI